MSVHHHDVKAEAKKYIGVFTALLVFTVITVAVSYLHVAVWLAIIIALLIAFTKGSLVASFFMHLVGEKKIIFYLLVMTFFFFGAMMLLFYISYHDLYEGMRYVP